MIVGRPTILVKRELLKNLKVDFDIEQAAEIKRFTLQAGVQAGLC